VHSYANKDMYQFVYCNCLRNSCK